VAKYRHLSQAPIIEAVIDLRVTPDAGKKGLSSLESFHALIKTRYPKQEKQRLLQGLVEFRQDAEPVSKVADDHIGYRFSSDDNLQIVIATLTGFTFSRLKPYNTWEHLKQEAYELWQLYKEAVKPQSITRVATRFINRLEIPLPIRDFNDYFLCAPVIPQSLPQGVTSYFSRVVIQEPLLNAFAIVTHALEQPARPNLLPFLLDIDVFKEAAFGSDKEVWETIDKLRKIKNDIFFENITERTAELFQ